MAVVDAGVLPTIKCSNCGIGVDISAMGDHVCHGSSPTPPAPPPKSDPTPPPGYSWEKPLPRIDPLMANRPFLQETGSNDDDTSNSNQSPPYGLQRSNTIPIPSEPPSPDWGKGIPAFPLPRSMSNRRPGALANMQPLGSAPPISIPHSPYADMDQGPLSARPAPIDREHSLPPPPPLPKDDDFADDFADDIADHVAPLPDFFHRRGDSLDSRSSYGTASIKYDNGSKRSTMMSSRRPSFGSVARDPQAFLDDGLLSRPAPLETLTENPTPTHQELGEEDTTYHNEKHDSSYSRFDFGISEKSNREAAIHRPSDSEQLDLSFHSRSDSRSGQLYSQRSPSQSSHSPAPSVDRFRDSREPFTAQYHGARQPSGSNHYLHPNNLSIDEGNRRKNSDASEGGNSVSNFARALGLDDAGHSTESSTVSSEFSPSESRSGTSLSSLPSETSLSRRKASEASRLGPVVEENQSHYDQPSPRSPFPMLEEASQSGSPLEPPKLSNFLQPPDSPTDPALSQGSLSLVSDQQSPRSENSVESPSDEQSPVSPEKERPEAIALAPPPPPRAPRSKGRCRGCGEAIFGKSVSSADGRLTGRYHRDCFACCYCHIPFQTADFYVLQNKPYCSQHYHELNGSLCSTCNAGIEGQYLETDERMGRGPSDRRKFHPDCLTCRTCNVNLKGEYFEWNGQVYCERDARRAAASVPPPRFRRPTMPSSPLSRPPDPYGPPGPMGPGPGPMGRPPFPPGPGRRPPPPMGQPMGPDLLGPPGAFGPAYGPAYGPPPGAKRFPERRTTRLMMI